MKMNLWNEKQPLYVHTPLWTETPQIQNLRTESCFLHMKIIPKIIKNKPTTTHNANNSTPKPKPTILTTKKSKWKKPNQPTTWG